MVLVYNQTCGELRVGVDEVQGFQKSRQSEGSLGSSIWIKGADEHLQPSAELLGKARVP